MKHSGMEDGEKQGALIFVRSAQERDHLNSVLGNR